MVCSPAKFKKPKAYKKNSEGYMLFSGPVGFFLGGGGNGLYFFV